MCIMGNNNKPLEELAEHGITILGSAEKIGDETKTVLIGKAGKRSYIIGPKEERGTMGFRYDLKKAKKNDITHIGGCGVDDSIFIHLKKPKRYYVVCQTKERWDSNRTAVSEIYEVSMEDYLKSID